MVALKTAQIEVFLRQPDPKMFCVLIYGPDAGLVHERAEGLARLCVDDPNDPFAFVRLEGDNLASDPARLADEAYTRAMFGGKRCIWVSAGSRSLAGAVEAILKGPEPEAQIIIEAGDIKKAAPLRTLCEKSPKAAVIPCYTDTDAALGRLIESTLSQHAMRIAPDALAALKSALGADRQATRSEIEKLALYAMGRPMLTRDDVAAVLTDSMELALDDVVDAAFTGQLEKCESTLFTLQGAGIAPSASLNAALRYALQLYPLRAQVEKGERPGAVLETGWRGLHFSRKALVEKALGTWSLERLTRAIARLGDAVAQSRQQGRFGEVIAHRTLVALAAESRR